MAESGQTTSQIPHILHFSRSTSTVGVLKYPKSFFEKKIAFWGHFSIQRPQPLQRPWKTIIPLFPFLKTLGLKFFIDLELPYPFFLTLDLFQIVF